MYEQLQVLTRYNRWMNDKVYTACASLGDAERRRDAGAFFRSIHGTLNHMLLVDRAWLGRFVGDRQRYVSRDASGAIIQVTGLDQVIYDDFDQLRRERERTDIDLRDWAETQTEQALSRHIAYRTSDGSTKEHPLWWAVLHAFNHQTHHRGQVTTLLTQRGIDIGDTDLILMLREGLG